MEETNDAFEELNSELKQKTNNFTGLLDQITTLNDKKKKLWLEIYENAISDRQSAHAMFMRLVKITQDKSSEHAVHGKTMATYIEKMSRSNDQLIKLAELIAEAEKKEESIDPDEMYSKLNGLTSPELH